LFFPPSRVNNNQLAKNDYLLSNLETMGELFVTIIFITALVLAVYWYAGYAVREGGAIDENQNYIPDSWEEKAGWFFKGRNLIILGLGILLGYVLGYLLPLA